MDANLLYTHQSKKPAPSASTSASQPAPSYITVASIPTIDRESLAELILSNPNSSDLAIVDVRDSDYIGGHIAGSNHVASSSLDYTLPELVKNLADKKTVVFHCMLSQQRGPLAALRYMRRRESQGLLTKGKGDAVGDASADNSQSAQKVYILSGGFALWQEK
jgi:rhodanese-related sulfurtransferase